MPGVCNLDPARLGPASAEAWNTLDMGLQREEVFWAIDVMTGWTEASDSTDFAMSRAEQYVNESDGDVRLREGLICLAGLLLVRVAQEAGSDTGTPDELRAILQDLARRLSQ